MNQEDVLTKILTKLDTIESDMANVKNDIVGMKDDIVGMKDDIVGMKDDIVSMKDDIVSMKDDIVSLKTDMSEVKEDVQSTRQIVARMEVEHGKKLDVLFDADIRDHEKIVEDILPRLDKHDQQIDTLEQHVVSLKRA